LDEKERTWCYVLSEGYWGIGALSSGGFSYDWFKDNFGQFESLKAQKMGSDIYQILDQYAAEVPPGSEGLIFLPFPTGELSPNWKVDARGAIVGLSSHHTKKHFVRAIMEGICLCRYSCFEALQGVVGEINTLRATGGFTKSREWLKIMSDVCGRELLLPQISETTCLGAAFLALKAIGELSNLKEVKDFVRFQGSVKPNIRNHQIYKKTYNLYKEVYDRLGAISSEIYNLQQELPR
jgi:gluconokinase